MQAQALHKLRCGLRHWRAMAAASSSVAACAAALLALSAAHMAPAQVKVLVCQATKLQARGLHRLRCRSRHWRAMTAASSLTGALAAALRALMF